MELLRQNKWNKSKVCCLLNEEENMMTNAEYRKFLIDGIMEFSDKFTVEELEKKPIRVLERIYDNC